MNKLEATKDSLVELTEIFAAPVIESEESRMSAYASGSDSDTDLACCCFYPMMAILTAAGAGAGFAVENFLRVPNATITGAGIGAAVFPLIFIGHKVAEA